MAAPASKTVGVTIHQFSEYQDYWRFYEIGLCRFAILTKEIEGEDEISILFKDHFWNVVLAAPLRAKKGIQITGNAVIALDRLYCETKPVEIKGPFVDLAPKGMFDPAHNEVAGWREELTKGSPQQVVSAIDAIFLRIKTQK